VLALTGKNFRFIPMENLERKSSKTTPEALLGLEQSIYRYIYKIAQSIW
jgi:hypothetical protein